MVAEGGDEEVTLADVLPWVRTVTGGGEVGVSAEAGPAATSAARAVVAIAAAIRPLMFDFCMDFEFLSW